MLSKLKYYVFTNELINYNNYDSGDVFKVFVSARLFDKSDGV